MPVGYLCGAFDLLNVRDLDLIDQARSRCRRLVLGVLTDDQVARLTGRAPVVPLVERMALLQHVRGVDLVVRHGEPSEVGASVTLAATPGALPGAELLTPRRETASPMLRVALRPAAAAAVA